MLVYKIRHTQQKNPTSTSDAFSIGVPGHIATFIPKDVKFLPELTPEGILFRPIKSKVDLVLPKNAPTWMRPEIEATLTADEREN